VPSAGAAAAGLGAEDDVAAAPAFTAYPAEAGGPAPARANGAYAVSAAPGRSAELRHQPEAVSQPETSRQPETVLPDWQRAETADPAWPEDSNLASQRSPGQARSVIGTVPPAVTGPLRAARGPYQAPGSDAGPLSGEDGVTGSTPFLD
jgi:hypothetical protein